MTEFEKGDHVLVTYDPARNHWMRGVVICAYFGASLIKYQVKLEDGVRDTFTREYMKLVPAVDLLAELTE
jgi:hypothetical protein